MCLRKNEQKNCIATMNETASTVPSTMVTAQFAFDQSLARDRTLQPASLLVKKLVLAAYRYEKLALCLMMARAVLKYGIKEAKWRKTSYIVMLHQIPYDVICTSKYLNNQRKYHFHNDISFVLITMLNSSINKELLIKMVRSIQEQTFEKWELYFVADASAAGIQDACDYLALKTIEDARIHYCAKENLEDYTLVNQCIESSRGQYVAFIDQHDLLHPAALFEIACAIEHANAQFVYTDAKSICQSDSNLVNTFYKPDYSPDLLRSFDYISHMFAFSKSLMSEVGGGLRAEYGAGAIYDLVLRLTEKTADNAIVHLQMPLYFIREQKNALTTFDGDCEMQKKALRDHLFRLNMNGIVESSMVYSTFRIRYTITDTPKISIVIPNKDNVEKLEICLNSILEKTTWQNFEIIIVENNSKNKGTFDYYKTIIRNDHRVKVVVWNNEFNYSQICNYGASFASGEYLLMLNNDTQVITPSWIEEMLMFAQRNDVGAVGAKLYYPNDTIQHGGVVVGFGGSAGHAHRGYPRNSTGYMNRLSVTQNISAVTGACMLIPMRIWNMVKGFDETLAVCYNDVDLCLRIRDAGYKIIWTPFAELYHHEGVSQIANVSSTKKDLYYREANDFQRRWLSSLMKGDPYYNRNLTVHGMSFCSRLHVS